MSLQKLINKYGLKHSNLHIHTILSDGDGQLYQILNKALKQKIFLIGNSNHNILPIQEDYIYAVSNPEYNEITIVPAIELDTHDSICGKVHLLGYFENPFNNLFSKEFKNKALDFERKHLSKIRKTTTERVQIAVTRFNEYVKNHPELNMKPDFEFSEVVNACQKRKQVFRGDKVQVELIDLVNPMLNRGYFKNSIEVETFFRGNKLILSRYNIELQDPRCEHSYIPSSETGIKLLQEIGATDIILAHPGSNVKICEFHNVDNLVQRLADVGMTGIEVYSKKNSDSVTKHYSLLADEKGLTKTAGGDNHRFKEIEDLRVLKI